MDCTVETSKCRKWGVDSFPTLTMFQDGQKVMSTTRPKLEIPFCLKTGQKNITLWECLHLILL